jgi:hypothetical protein
MILTDAKTLDLLLSGWTHFMPMGSGEAIIYYRTDGGAHMSLPDGTVRAGHWQVTATGYHVDWRDGPSADWQLDAAPGRIAYVDAGGVERAIVSRIEAGDTARLAG